jgi:hypothetical protein
MPFQKKVLKKHFFEKRRLKPSLSNELIYFYPEKNFHYVKKRALVNSVPHSLVESDISISVKYFTMPHDDHSSE